MQDKIEVGEYVRTKEGIFYRYIQEQNEKYFIGKNYFEQYLENIVKHSKNIINLIEEGDYVNGYKVLEIRKHFEVQPYRISIMVYKTKDAEFWKSLEEQDIEDIVTHEQFDSVKYKAGE